MTWEQADAECERIMAMSDEAFLAEVAAEGIDIELEASIMQAPFELALIARRSGPEIVR